MSQATLDALALSPAGSSACGPARPDGWPLRWGEARRPRDAEVPRPRLTSEAQRAVDGNHRGTARVDGVDDLGVVDALQIGRRDAEVAVAELALDDDPAAPPRAPSQRHGHGAADA